MMNINITETTINDCHELASIMRKSDIDEVYATGHFTPIQALLVSFNNSLVTYTVRIDNELVMIYGVSKLQFVHGAAPWMLASNNINKYGVTFYRTTKKHVLAMVSTYGYLENYVDARNTQSIRWLKWLGFTLHKAESYGIEKLPFHRFSLTIK